MTLLFCPPQFKKRVLLRPRNQETLIPLTHIISVNLLKYEPLSVCSLDGETVKIQILVFFYQNSRMYGLFVGAQQ